MTPDPYRSGRHVCCGACGAIMSLIGHGGTGENGYRFYRCSGCGRGWQNVGGEWSKFEARDYGGVA